jgi:excisionase family DNA binding protein
MNITGLTHPKRRASMPEPSHTSHQALLAINNAATYMDDTVRHLRRLVDERRIPFTRVGGKIRFRKSDLDAYIEERTVKATS